MNKKYQHSNVRQSVVRHLATAATATLIACIVLVAMSSTACAEYRYALIINTNANINLESTVSELKKIGFQCTEANWKSDRDFQNGIASFMSKTAVNSTVLVVYKGKVSITTSKSKEFRGHKSLGIHGSDNSVAYPMVDMIHTMDSVGGSRMHIIYVDADDSVDKPQPTVPDGFIVTFDRAENLIDKLASSEESVGELSFG